MTDKHPNGAFVFWSACLLVFAASCALAQQANNPARMGVPQDWTQHQIIFSREGLVHHPDLVYNEPRVMHRAVQRWQRPGMQFLQGGWPPRRVSDNSMQRDWNVSLGNGRLSPNMYPAKYSFDPSLPPDCANDYAVFGLNVGGVTNRQANLVAFNNLYAGNGGFCGAAPSVMFAYNVSSATGGRIQTSTVLSADGKKIAFLENVGGGTVFHVIKWTAGSGTAVNRAAAPPAFPDFTSLTVSGTAISTRSSPWVDYNTDSGYLGTDDGLIYKILNVFKGIPTLAGAPWPVTISPTYRLTPAVLDKNLGLLMVGSQNGVLYSINTTTGAVKSLVIGVSGGRNPGIFAPPIVDVSNGTTFAVSANDGPQGGVLVEVDTASMTVMAKGRLGIGSRLQGVPTVTLYQPAFSDSYFNDPSTGVVRLCGTGAATTEPWQYAFGFTGRTMNTTPVFSQQLVTSTAARCTGWTEFFNPNVGSGGTDFFFFGLNQDCTAAGTAGGCVVARANDNPLASLPVFTVNGGPSGIVVDNFNTTVGQASSIYFSGAGTPNTAYKLTQNGLQ